MHIDSKFHVDQMLPYQESLSAFREVDVDSMLAGVKDYLLKANRANRKPQDQGHFLENGVYTVNESDVQGLINCVLDLADQLCNKRRPHGTAEIATVAGSLSSQAPKLMHPVASTTVDPATTITITEAAFVPAVGKNDGGRQRVQTATTTTVISHGNVTEITWLYPNNPVPAMDPDVETIPGRPSPGTSKAVNQPRKAETTRTGNHPDQPYPGRYSSVDSRYNTTVDHDPGSSTGNNTRNRRQSSMVVFTDATQPDPEGGPRSAEGSGLPATVFERIRKKSVQFGQAMGSYLNGAYQNADHKPRRDSSEVCSALK